MVTPHSEALAHFHAVADAKHRFWTYYQAIALAVVAVAWARETALSRGALFALGMGFTVYALLNLRLVYESNSAAEASQRWVLSLVPSNASPEERAAIESITKTSPTKWVVALHLMFTGVALAAIGWRAAVEVAGGATG